MRNISLKLAAVLLSMASISSAQKYRVSKPETVVKSKPMKELGIREFDIGIYMKVERENCKWFSTYSKTPEGQIIFQDKHLNDYPTIISTWEDNEITGKSFYVYYLKH